MADDKKSPEKKPLPTAGELGMRLLAILIILWIISRLLNVLSSIRFTAKAEVGVLSPLASFLHTVFPFFKLWSFGVSVLCFVGIGWLMFNSNKIALAQKALIHVPVDKEWNGESAPEPKNRRWEKVLKHMSSDNQSDWKFAIIEADIMLSEMLDTMSYRGETIADKLKKVEPSDFQTIEAAWEAHKIRNIIAHEGADFLITEREVKRVIGLYRAVFEEFHYI
jgi:hypothetical protein